MARLQIRALKQGSNECKRTHSNYYKHKLTACSFRADQHDSRSIHSTNQPTKINEESSSPLIVVHLDSKIVHEGEITTSSTHTDSNECKRTRCSFRAGQHDTSSIHPTNQSTKINAESSSPLIVVYLDSKITHEGDITTSSTHSHSQQWMQTYALFVWDHTTPGRSSRAYIQRTNERTNEDQRIAIVVLNVSKQQNSTWGWYYYDFILVPTSNTNNTFKFKFTRSNTNVHAVRAGPTRTTTRCW